MTGLRTTGIALGAVALLVGAMTVISGHDNLTSSARDADGYIMFDPTPFDRSSSAIVIEDTEVLKGRFAVHADNSGIPGWSIEDLDVRIQGTGRADGLFIGIGATSAVAEYLSGVEHDVIADVDLDVGTVSGVEYTRREGTVSPPGPPGLAGFWETSVEGAGALTLDWTVPSGEWTAVVMNADASSGVSADLVFGAKASNIAQIAWTKIAIGLTALIVGGLAVFFGLRGRGRDLTPLATDLGELPDPDVAALREASTTAP